MAAFPSAFLLLSAIGWSWSQGAAVSTSKGNVEGFHVDYGDDRTKLYYGSADVFLGIPFAEPPIGDLRFKVS